MKNSELQERLTSLWDKYFDHIYCIHYLPFQNRLPALKNELKRVGILQSSKFSFKYTFDSPFHEKLQHSDIILSQDTLKNKLSAFKCALGHYEVMKEAQSFSYTRILILEDDVRFLNDLNVLYGILADMPRDYDIVLFDTYPFHPKLIRMLQEEKPVNKNYTNFVDSFNSASCYALTKDAINSIIIQQESNMVVADDAYHNLHNDNLKRCFANINLSQQIAFDDKEKEKEIRILYSMKGNNPDLYNKKVYMHVLIGCYFFQNLTGSEIYYYEVAKTLLKLGYKVTVAATIVGEGQLANLMRKEIGDNAFRIITKSQLEQEGIDDYDIAIASHTPIVKTICDLKEKAKSNLRVINIIHGEYLEMEQPYVSSLVDYYIGIRPSIVQILYEKYNIINCKNVWNPFDINRFQSIKQDKTFDIEKEGNVIFFCGTVDALRKEAIIDMAKHCMSKKWKLLLVGQEGNYLNALLKEYPCIEYHSETNNIEEYLKQADATCGILIGRTTIEGWLCGLPSFVYDIDKNYHILNRTCWTPPKDLTRFDETKVVKTILETVGE